MTDSIVERAARAIYEAGEAKWTGTSWEDATNGLGRGVSSTFDAYYCAAYAAIEAMREPTEAMVKAVWRSSLGGSLLGAERSYIAAIDAALKDSQ